MQFLIPRVFVATAAAAVLLSSGSQSVLFAQQQDGPPVDVAQLLQALKAVREAQQAQIKLNKQKAVQEVRSAASSGAAAAAAWEEAVRQVQFNGSARENSAFRDWKGKEGDALGEKEVQNAARLYFNWLDITLQRSSGATIKDLMPAIIAHTKEVTLDQVAMEGFEEKLKHEKDQVAAGKRPGAKDKVRDDGATKKLHDQILKGGLGGSMPVQALKISEFVGIQGWEGSPGDVEGIFNTIILPELRAQRDPRILEYWDMKIKREGEAVAKSQLAFETERFNQVKRPELLWKKTQDVLALGQKNKAVADMFTLIKTYPTHPNAPEWIGKLEQLLTPGGEAVGAGVPAGTR